MIKSRIEHVDYIVFVHRLYDAGEVKTGGLDILVRQLIKSGRAVAYIESPLLPSAYPYVTLSVAREHEIEILHKFKFISTYAPISRVHEVLLLLLIPILYNFRNLRCITSDPLTTLPAVVLRKIGFFKYVYYHCIDYSKTRFKNFTVNLVYKILLHIGLRNADLVGCVTRKTMTILAEIGLTKLFYIPNSPSVADLAEYFCSIENRERYTLVVTCAGISEKYRILDLVKLTEKLRKTYPKIRLIVIGSTDFERAEFDTVRHYVDDHGLNRSIVFLGQLRREDSLKEVAKSWVGLAFYNKNYSHVNFGDSLKIREYAALGVPIVSDRTTPTSLEMEEFNSGLVVDEPWHAAAPIVRLFEDPALYAQLSQKALSWAKVVDKPVIVDNLITNYLEKK